MKKLLVKFTLFLFVVGALLLDWFTPKDFFPNGILTTMFTLTFLFCWSVHILTKDKK